MAPGTAPLSLLQLRNQVLITADDRRSTVARLSRGKAEATKAYPKARNHWGHVPLGYVRIKRGLEVDEDRAEIVRCIYSLAKGGRSSAGVAKQLETKATA